MTSTHRSAEQDQAVAPTVTAQPAANVNVVKPGSTPGDEAPHVATGLLGIDIGGTKIAGGWVLDTAPAEVHRVADQPTEAQAGPEQVMANVARVIEAALESAAAAGVTIRAIGVGAPGVIDSAEGSVSYAGPTMPGWAGTGIASIIRERFHLPCYVHNDVRIMGLGEVIHGGGRGYSDVLFVSLGTGIGGAIVTGGQLHHSPHGSRGEIAFLLGQGPEGIARIEDIASGPSLAKHYRARRQAVDPAGFAADGVGEWTLREIMASYHAGDALAREVLDECLGNVGRALGAFVSALDVSAIVIGGGVGNIGPAITEPLFAGIREQAIDVLKDIPLTVATLGTDAPLVGAAEWARQQLARQ